MAETKHELFHMSFSCEEYIQMCLVVAFTTVGHEGDQAIWETLTGILWFKVMIQPMISSYQA